MPAQPNTRPSWYWDPGGVGGALNPNSFASPTAVQTPKSARSFGSLIQRANENAPPGMQMTSLVASRAPRSGEAWLSQILNDPYNIPEAGLRQGLQGADQAYNVAAQRAKRDTLGSGATASGVARGTRAGVESARAGSMADVLRNWEQYKTQLGDQRLATLYSPQRAGLYDAASRETYGNYNRLMQSQRNQPGGWERTLSGIAQIAPYASQAYDFYKNSTQKKDAGTAYMDVQY